MAVGPGAATCPRLYNHKLVRLIFVTAVVFVGRRSGTLSSGDICHDKVVRSESDFQAANSRNSREILKTASLLTWSRNFLPIYSHFCKSVSADQLLGPPGR